MSTWPSLTGLCLWPPALCFWGQTVALGPAPPDPTPNVSPALSAWVFPVCQSPSLGKDLKAFWALLEGGLAPGDCRRGLLTTPGIRVVHNLASPADTIRSGTPQNTPPLPDPLRCVLEKQGLPLSPQPGGRVDMGTRPLARLE